VAVQITLAKTTVPATSVATNVPLDLQDLWDLKGLQEKSDLWDLLEEFLTMQIFTH
jgi:hypothetical protein